MIKQTIVICPKFVLIKKTVIYGFQNYALGRGKKKGGDKNGNVTFVIKCLYQASYHWHLFQLSCINNFNIS